MEHTAQTVASDQLRSLRDGIRTRYDHYHALDGHRFPALEYNTSRANYEPLRESFEEEFYVVRGLDRLNNNLSIPSTHTLALIFSNDDYWPGRKILNTCRSYAEGKSFAPPTNAVFSDAPARPYPTVWPRGRWWLLGLIVPVGFALYVVISYLTGSSRPAGLVISQPHHGQTAPRRLAIEGTVSNADTVWVVVHPVGRAFPVTSPITQTGYYVQPPIVADAGGVWKGQIHIGSANKGDAGIRFQIRAFVHPDKQYRVLDEFDRYVFNAWPRAELSTEAIEVVRAPNDQ